ncbi:MAG: DUF6049 family protein [Ornithinimicrobium sp.]
MPHDVHLAASQRCATPRRVNGQRGVRLLLALVVVIAALGAAPLSALASSPTGVRVTDTQEAVARESVPTQASPSVQVEIDRVVPAVVGPGQRWVVRGTISNNGSTTVDVERVQLRTAYQALDTVDEIEGWIDDGDIIQTPRVLGSDVIASPLAAQESTSFVIAVSPDAVAPGFAFTSLPLRLDVEAADETPLAEVRTVLPWFADSTAENPLEVSWVVPLTVPPNPELTATEPGRTQAWLSVVGPESPARIWLDGLTSYEATFVVDPSLLLPLPAATSIAEAPAGEPVPAPSSDAPGSTETAEPAPSPDTTSDNDAPGTTTPSTPTPDGAAEGPADRSGATGDGGSSTDVGPQTPLSTPEVPEATPVQEAELGFQERLGALTRDQLRWLPVADPDVAALIDVGVEETVVDGALNVSLPPSVLDTNRLLQRGTHGVAWPAWTTIDASKIEALRAVSTPDPLTTLILPRSAFSDATGFNRDAVGSSVTDPQVALYGYNEQVSAVLNPTDPATATGDGAITQLLLAHLLARYQQFPADSGGLIIAPPRGASIEASALDDVTSALEEAPWVVQVPADDLPVSQDVRLGPISTAPEPAASPLSVGAVDRIEAIRADLEDIAKVLQQQETGQAWLPVLDGLYSTRWRGSDEEWSALLEQVESALATVIDGVRIQETSVNFLANEGVIQLTLVNDLPIGLQDLELELVPGNPRLRVAEQPLPISIGPSSRATVQFRAEAVAAGQVPVRATLSTPTGLQIGQAQVLDVQVRPTGIWIYWLLGGVAGVILILGLTRAIRRPAAPPDSDST